MNHFRKAPALFAATLLATACVSSYADTTTLALDLSAGNTSFGRNNAVGSFVDTYTFTLVGSFFLTATATTARSGSQDLDFSSLVIQNASNVVVATFAGNLGTPSNEFYSLNEITLGAGAYRLIVSGTNSPTQASYSGNVAVTAVPEPGTLAMLMAGLGTMVFIRRRRPAS